MIPPVGKQAHMVHPHKVQCLPEHVPMWASPVLLTGSIVPRQLGCWQGRHYASHSVFARGVRSLNVHTVCSWQDKP